MSVAAAAALKTRGDALYKANDAPAAVACFAEALEALDEVQKAVDTLRLRCLLNVAAARLRTADLGLAEAACTAALALDPRSVKGRYRRGAARLRLGDASGALEDLEEAVRLGPDDRQIAAACEQARSAARRASPAEATPAPAAAAPASPPTPATPPPPPPPPPARTAVRRRGPAFRPASTRQSRPAIVTTLKDAAATVESFVRYHLSVGFAHVFLYFDDPEDAGVPVARRFGGDAVTVVLRDAALQREWRALEVWSMAGQFADSEVQARQQLNAAHALKRCLAGGGGGGVDWLLHIDSDELFYCPQGDAAAHFSGLSAEGVKVFHYANYEGVPEGGDCTGGSDSDGDLPDASDPFRAVTLFRRHFDYLPRTAAAQAAVGYWSDRQAADRHFLFYDNGKAACRVEKGMVPISVHEWAPPKGTPSSAWRTNLAGLARRGAGDEDGAAAAIAHYASDALVLHYCVCSYAALEQKYRSLGHFPNAWFGGAVPIEPSFHRQARDAFLSGAGIEGPGEAEGARRKVDFGPLRKLYAATVRLDDTDERARQLGSGVCCRLKLPAQVLARAAAAAAAAENGGGNGGSSGGASRPVAVASPAAAAAARVPVRAVRAAEPAAPLVDVFVRNRGLAAAPSVAAALGTKGWCVCSAGIPPSLLATARDEIEALRGAGALELGGLTLRGGAVDVPDNVRQRDDVITWLENSGSKPKCPACAALEKSIDSFMQGVSGHLAAAAGLALTERTDTMLACYPGGGARYGVHCDNADGDGRPDGRKITLVLYLNEDWREADGGYLRVYDKFFGGPGFDCAALGGHSDVRPQAGHVALFASDKIMHEVLPSRRVRCAMTVWYMGVEVPRG